MICGLSQLPHTSFASKPPRRPFRNIWPDSCDQTRRSSPHKQVLTCLDMPMSLFIDKASTSAHAASLSTYRQPPDPPLGLYRKLKLTAEMKDRSDGYVARHTIVDLQTKTSVQNQQAHHRIMIHCLQSFKASCIVRPTRSIP